MNELEIISVSIIIIVVIAKCVILIKYLCSIKNKSYKKYQKSSLSAQLMKKDPESINNYAINEHTNSNKNIIQEPDYLTNNSDIFYDTISE